MSLKATRGWTMRLLVAGLAVRPAILNVAIQNFLFRKAIGSEARIQALRRLGAIIGEGCFLGAGVSVRIPAHLTIGNSTKMHGKVWIDSWDSITFGSNVLVNSDVMFLTASHEVNSRNFNAFTAPIVVGDYAWLPVRIIVMPGAHIGEGAVVGTGSIVTHPVPPYTVVAGNPARPIAQRQKQAYTYP